MNNFFKEYKKFVKFVTSPESSNLNDFSKRLKDLDKNDVNIVRFLTAGLGMASESGEFNEILKKILFQGKPLTDENIFHLKRELGDIMFYWIEACLALNLDPIDVINENISKLKSRYPDGFEVQKSENRKQGDL